MGKHKRKVDKKLAERIASYEIIRNKQGYVKPGSQNMRKQGAGVPKKFR